MTSDRRRAAALCCVLVLGIAGLMTFQTLIPTIMPLWGLSSTEAGFVAAVGFAAYAVVAPVVVALTDRIDARRVVATGLLLSTVSGLGFALAADGFWSALLWRLLGGLGMAATYMPGLKALTDRVHGPELGRLQSFYTASYSVGTAASVFAAGVAADLAGWRAAFVVSGLLPALALVLLLLALRPVTLPPHPAGAGFLDPRPVLRDRPAMAYIWGYAGHCFELFGFRTWMVAFLTFAAAHGGSEVQPSTIALLVTGALLMGLPASVMGNERAMRGDRRATLSRLMPAAAMVGLLFGLGAWLPFWLLALAMAAYSALMMSDSAALTVGLVAASPASRQGLSIGVQQLAGTAAAVAAPLLSGMALDGLGRDNVLGWWAAFAILALGPLLGILTLRAMLPAAQDREAVNSVSSAGSRTAPSRK
ncbi:MAG: MFS transporter [Geminicoccaceae bacterium]